MELLARSLPKWPALVVAGNPITRDEACEVLIRTQDFHFSTNDRAFQREIEDLLGIPEYDYSTETLRPHYDAVDARYKEYQCLGLEYLQNRRIVSCYIGGPHGWCNWNGRIHCDSYNIGKWPTCEAVFKEWQLIATAFPFLTLTSQLWSGEQCEESTKPIIQFNIADGKATVHEPTASLYRPVNDFTLFGHERGCTVQELSKALEMCRKRLA